EFRSVLDSDGLSHPGTSMRSANPASVANASKAHVIDGCARCTLVIGQLLRGFCGLRRRTYRGGRPVKIVIARIRIDHICCSFWQTPNSRCLTPTAGCPAYYPRSPHPPRPLG